MNYVFIDLFYYILWPVVFFTRLRQRTWAATEELLVLLFAVPTAIISEMTNEHLFGATAVYYPHTLLYFPGFKFPVTIILSSSLFPWLLFVAARALANRLATQNRRAALGLQLGFFLVLVSTFVLPEAAGPQLGYWKWRVTPPDTPGVWIAKYIFYLLFMFPPVLVAKFFSWRAQTLPAPTSG
jgi:hypothetical protein